MGRLRDDAGSRETAPGANRRRFVTSHARHRQGSSPRRAGSVDKIPWQACGGSPICRRAPHEERFPCSHPRSSNIGGYCWECSRFQSPCGGSRWKRQPSLRSRHWSGIRQPDRPSSCFALRVARMLASRACVTGDRQSSCCFHASAFAAVATGGKGSAP